MLGPNRKHQLGGAHVVRPRRYRESGAQGGVVKWVRARPDWMVMRLENAQKRTPAQAARDRALGMEPGAPDLVLLYKRVVVFLEMKDGVGGKVKPYQEDVHAQLRARGQIILVGYGEADAIAKLEAVARGVDGVL
jgi:hypothetical protein